MSACPKGSTIAVTGADGFIASHIVDHLLLAGYNVRGTVRDTDKAAALSKIMHGRHDSSRFAPVVVPELSVPGACDGAFQGCAGVVHSAQDMSMGADPEIITKTLNIATSVLESTAKTPSVNRLVWTNSVNAAHAPKAGTTYHIKPSDWDDRCIEAAKTESPTQGFEIYYSAKVQAERTAWNFVRDRKPGFILDSVLTNLNVGPSLSEQPRSSGRLVPFIYGNVEAYTKFVSNEAVLPPQQMLDVRDTARLHVLAMSEEDVKGERLLAAAEKYDFNTLLSIVRKIAPQGHKLPAEVEGLAKSGQTIEDKRSVELLRRMGRQGWSPVEEAVREAIQGEAKSA